MLNLLNNIVWYQLYLNEGWRRAKDKLNLIVPQRFYTHHQARAGDRHVFAGRSRFIARIGRWPARKKSAAPIAQAPIDIRERMRGKWSKTG